MSEVKKIQCEGGNICVVENGGHSGEVKAYDGGRELGIVYYCDFAVERDRENGFLLDLIDPEKGNS